LYGITIKCAGVAVHVEFPNPSHSPQPGDLGRYASKLEPFAEKTMKPLAVGILLLVFPVTLAAETRSIKVTAKSEIKVAPDEVVLELKVHTRDKALLNAKKENDKIATAVLALAPKHALPATDVKITDLDVSPDYGTYTRRRPTPIAYDFTRSIEIRLTDFKKIEPFLSDAFDPGLSHVNRLHFRVSNQRKHQFEARKLAVTYAREKAEHLTELTGMKLGSPIRIEEGVEDNWDAGGFGGAGIGLKLPGKENNKIASNKPRIVYTSFQQGDNQKAKDSLTARGQIKITAHVTVEFEMSPK